MLHCIHSVLLLCVVLGSIITSWPGLCNVSLCCVVFASTNLGCVVKQLCCVVRTSVVMLCCVGLCHVVLCWAVLCAPNATFITAGKRAHPPTNSMLSFHSNRMVIHPPLSLMIIELDSTGRLCSLIIHTFMIQSIYAVSKSGIDPLFFCFECIFFTGSDGCQHKITHFCCTFIKSLSVCHWCMGEAENLL